jgi:aromatic ring-opening dioxygenase catalytic subunit (LigB family)
VVQLSIDENQPSSFHYEIGKRIAPLREEGVLIVGSGNLVHNLHAYAWGKHTVQPYDWAVRFERNAKELLLLPTIVPLSTMRALVATHYCRFQPQTTIFRFSMSSVRVLVESTSASRLRE